MIFEILNEAARRGGSLDPDTLYFAVFSGRQIALPLTFSHCDNYVSV